MTTPPLTQSDSARKVFLSYSWKDRDLAEGIRSKLEESGARVWSDSLQIVPGTNIRDAIDDAIRSADDIVILLSNDALSSTWTTIELATAIASAVQADRPRLIPVLAEKGIRIPPLIADTKYVDASSRDGRDAAIESLVRAVYESPSLPLYRDFNRHTQQLKAERDLLKWEKADLEGTRASRRRTADKVMLVGLGSGVVTAVVGGWLVGLDFLNLLLPVVAALVGLLAGVVLSSRVKFR